MEDLFKKIIANSYTPTDLRRRVHLLKTLVEAKLYNKKTVSEIEVRDKKWASEIVTGDITTDNFTKIFSDIAEKVDTISSVVIFVPIKLPQEEIEKLCQKMREIYQKDIFIEVRLDPLLIGGAAFGVNGLYKDYSIRKKIEENKKSILTRFQEHIHN